MTTQRLVRISYFTMLTIIGGLIKIPVPVFPTVMFTLQTLFVIASGLILGPKDGALSQIAYMLLGLVGLPVFTKGGGFWYVSEPSFGYIVSFCLGAALSGTIKSRFRTLSVLKLFFAAESGLALIYLIGMPYQFFIVWLALGASPVAALGTLTTLPFMFIIDSVMLYALCLIYPRIMKLIGLPTQPFESAKNSTSGPIVNNDESK